MLMINLCYFIYLYLINFKKYIYRFLEIICSNFRIILEFYLDQHRRNGNQ